METRKIRLLIVSDNRLYREALAGLLDGKGLVCVVGTACNAQNAIGDICECNPDVVLIDMSTQDSCKVFGSIIPSYPNTKIVALAITENQDSILKCAKAGIAGYVSRDATLDQLVNTVSAVIKGEIYCPRRIAEGLFNKIKSLSSYEDIRAGLSEENRNDSIITLLTSRERQIVSLISDGLSNKQIARKLTIEISTVKNHIHNILTKTGTQNRIQVANLLQQVPMK